MLKQTETDASFILNPHYIIENRPDFLEDSCELSLTDRSKNSFSLGKPGQGYVGLVDLQTGLIHLVASFNKDDGLERLDEYDMSFDCYVESTAKLGKLAGDLHINATRILGLEGKKSHILGFGIWKAGASIKFVKNIPKEAGRVPFEFLFIKENNGFKLFFINENRVAMPKAILELDSFFGSCDSISLPDDKITVRDREQIKSILEKNMYLYDMNRNRDWDQKIKYVKNRSTSQNALAIRYTKEYSQWFLARNQDHTSHANDLIRELPREVFKKILDTIARDLHSPPDIMEKSVALARGVDGIFNHLLLEKFWMSYRRQALLEFGLITYNPSLVDKAICLGATLSETISHFRTNNIADLMDVFIDTAITMQRKKIISLLVTYAKRNAQDSQVLLSHLKIKLAKKLFPEHEEFLAKKIEELEISNTKSMSFSNVISALIGKKNSHIAELCGLIDDPQLNINYSDSYCTHFDGRALDSIISLAYFLELGSIIEKMLQKKLNPYTLQTVVIAFYSLDTSATQWSIIKCIFSQIKNVFIINDNDGDGAYQSEHFFINGDEKKQNNSCFKHTLMLRESDFHKFLEKLITSNQMKFFLKLVQAAPLQIQKKVFLCLSKKDIDISKMDLTDYIHLLEEYSRHADSNFSEVGKLMLGLAPHLKLGSPPPPLLNKSQEGECEEKPQEIKPSISMIQPNISAAQKTSLSSKLAEITGLSGWKTNNTMGLKIWNEQVDLNKEQLSSVLDKLKAFDCMMINVARRTDNMAVQVIMCTEIKINKLLFLSNKEEEMDDCDESQNEFEKHS